MTVMCAFALCGQNGHFPLPGIGTKNQTLLEELDVSSSIPINWFISCNDRLLDGTTTHTAQRRSYERNVTRGYEQRHNEVRWHPGQEASLAAHVRSWGLSETNVLYWKKYMWVLWHCWNLLGSPAVIRHPHIDSPPRKLCTPCPLITHLGTKTYIGSL